MSDAGNTPDPQDKGTRYIFAGAGAVLGAVMGIGVAGAATAAIGAALGGLLGYHLLKRL